VRRRTLIVAGPLAFRMQRLAAARAGAAGLQLMTLPQLAARLAGGFTRPAVLHDLEPAIQQALTAGGYAEFEPMLALPGTPRALLTTLRKIWDADLDLQALAPKAPRLADLALIERRAHAALPVGALTPRALRDEAMQRLQFARAALGPIELEGRVEVAPVWRPLLDALADSADLSWRAPPGTSNHRWFRGKLLEVEIPPAPTPELASCANPNAEAVEALRWMRELLASGKARPEEIAITAASPQACDDHFLVLTHTAGLPLHFSHGVPALSTRDGQACAALADTLLNGISQDRVRRLLGYATGQETMLKELPRAWAAGLPSEAGLFEVDHWRRALALAAAYPDEPDPAPVLLPVIELMAEGVSAANKAGEGLLGPASQGLWAEAFRRAPAEALEYSLQELRVPDGRDPGVSAVWCPASHLAGAPRPWVWVIGMTSRAWPGAQTEDPILPDHILAQRTLDPDPISERDRRAFAVIMRGASGGSILSRSRRDAQGKPLAPSPLLRPFGAAQVLRRDRIPAHAFSEADRLAARPQEAAVMPAVAAATQCWTHWRRPVVTAHDGRIRPDHPMIRRALDQTQSATSLRLLLRDPLCFVWQYALGWHATRQEEQPLTLDARSYGELVHELLKRAVDTLEPDPGYGRATPVEIENALAAAVEAVAARWALERSIPPQLLWQHTLEAARQLAFKALTLDEPFRTGTRSWTELRFGEPELTGAGELPWDPQQPVRIPGTNVLLRGVASTGST